jgi:hypothetical protein
MTKRFFANAAATELSAPITNADTAMTVLSAATFPSQFPYTLVLDPGTSLEEAVDVTAAVGSVLTVTRGVDGYAAQAHAAGAAVDHRWTKRDAEEANTHANATTDVHGRTGSLVDTDTVQAVVGQKTFTDLRTVSGGPVVGTGDAQTVTGAKVFDSLATTAGGSVVAVGGAQTITGAKAFQGSNSHSGTETFTGDVAVDGANINGDWTPFAVQWRDGGGTLLSIGNGTLEGWFKRISKTVHFRIKLVRGSTTHFGTTFYTFSVPVTMQDYVQCGAATVYNDSVNTFHARTWQGVNSGEIILVDAAGVRVSSSAPIVWDPNDSIFISGTYEAV